MRQFLSALLLGAVLLALVAAVTLFGAVTFEFAAPLYALALVAALLWAAKLLLGRAVVWAPSPVHLPVVAFFIYALIRYWRSPIEYDSRIELFHLGLYCFIFFLAATNLARSRDRSALIFVLASLALAESIYGLWQFITHAQTCLHLRRPEMYFHRAGGTYICPNHLAGFLEIVLAMVVARVVVLRPAKTSLQRTALQKVILGYVILVILAGFVATLSRAGWISFTVGFVTFLLLKGWQTRTIWPRVSIAVGGILILLIIFSQIGPVREYIQISLQRNAMAPKLENDAGLGARISMWRASLRIIAEHPLFGTGPGTWQWFHQVYRDPAMQMHPLYAHNDFLNFASDYGLIGFALLALIAVMFFRHAARFLRDEISSEQRSFAMGTIVAVVIILLHSIFDFNLHIPANAFLLVCLAGSCIAMSDRRPLPSRPAANFWVRLMGALLLVALAGGVAWLGGRTALAQYHVRLGTEAKEVVDFEAAVAHFQRAIALDPKYPDPYARLGDIYSTYAALPHRPGREDNREAMLNYAIDVYLTSHKLNPYQPGLLVRLATAYDKSGDIESALAAFQDALAVDPNNAATYFHLGNFYLKLGESQKARAAFTKSQELNYWIDPGARIHLDEIKPSP